MWFLNSEKYGKFDLGNFGNWPNAWENVGKPSAFSVV